MTRIPLDRDADGNGATMAFAMGAMGFLPVGKIYRALRGVQTDFDPVFDGSIMPTVDRHLSEASRLAAIGRTSLLIRLALLAHFAMLAVIWLGGLFDMDGALMFSTGVLMVLNTVLDGCMKFVVSHTRMESAHEVVEAVGLMFEEVERCVRATSRGLPAPRDCDRA